MKNAILIFIRLCICIALSLSACVNVNALTETASSLINSSENILQNFDESAETDYLPPLFESLEELNHYIKEVISRPDDHPLSLASSSMLKIDKHYYLPILAKRIDFNNVVDYGAAGLSFMYSLTEEQDAEHHHISVVYRPVSFEGKSLTDAISDTRLEWYGPFSSITDNQNNEVLISKDEKRFLGFIDNKYFYYVRIEGLDINAKSLMNEISFIKVPLGTSNEKLVELLASQPEPVSSEPVSGESASNGQSSDTSGAPKNPDTGGLDALPIAGIGVAALLFLGTARVVWRKKSRNSTAID